MQAGWPLWHKPAPARKAVGPQHPPLEDNIEGDATVEDYEGYPPLSISEVRLAVNKVKGRKKVPGLDLSHIRYKG